MTNEERYNGYCAVIGVIDYDIWASTKEISLMGLSLSILDLSIFPDTLESLEIKNSSIQTIQSAIKHTMLTRLIVKESKLEELSLKRRVPNLSLLWLPNNRLRHLDVPDAHIYNLDVSGNNLDYIKMNHQRLQMISFDVSGNSRLTKLPHIDTYILSMGVKNCPYLYGMNSDIVTDVVL